jgi:hypothetical protein
MRGLLRAEEEEDAAGHLGSCERVYCCSVEKNTLKKCSNSLNLQGALLSPVTSLDRSFNLREGLNESTEHVFRHCFPVA